MNWVGTPHQSLTILKHQVIWTTSAGQGQRQRRTSVAQRSPNTACPTCSRRETDRLPARRASPSGSSRRQRWLLEARTSAEGAIIDVAADGEAMWHVRHVGSEVHCRSITLRHHVGHTLGFQFVEGQKYARLMWGESARRAPSSKVCWRAITAGRSAQTFDHGQIFEAEGAL